MERGKREGRVLAVVCGPLGTESHCVECVSLWCGGMCEVRECMESVYGVVQCAEWSLSDNLKV